MSTTGTLPAPGTAEGRVALEREARSHGFRDAHAYTEAYTEGRVDIRGVGDRPGDPRTGFGQVQAYAKAAALAGLVLVEYAALAPTGPGPAEPTTTDDTPPPQEAPEEQAPPPEPLDRPRPAAAAERVEAPAAPRPETAFQSTAATVAVVDMADGEAFDGVHSLDLVTPPPPPEPEADAASAAAPEAEPAFGTGTPDDPAEPSTVDGPVFGAGFPLAPGEIDEPAEAAGSGTADIPVEAVGVAEPLPDAGAEEVAEDPQDAGDADGGDDVADLQHDFHPDFRHEPQHDDADPEPDPEHHESHEAHEPDAGDTGESFT